MTTWSLYLATHHGKGCGIMVSRSASRWSAENSLLGDKENQWSQASRPGHAI